MTLSRNINILIAEDDEDDILLIQKAFEKCLPRENIVCVTDGELLLQYLRREDPYTNTQAYPDPDIILLDLNMPRKDGKAALEEIKRHENFKKIPVIIFTTSTLKNDIDTTYSLGGNSFITKPGNFEELVKVTQEINAYWAKTVLLPGEN
ncbi:response regulator [Algoriphagus namhaensis]